MAIQRDPTKWLRKKNRTGFRGYPVGTIAFYGPDDRTASKVAVGVIEHEGEAAHLRRWLSDTADVRRSEAILREVADFLRTHAVRTVTMIDGIFGCPHEEGIDYPDDETCPLCPFWAEHDRFAGRSEAADPAVKARAIAALLAQKDGR